MTKQVELPEASDTVEIHVPVYDGATVTNKGTAVSWNDYYTADQMRQFREEGIKDALVKLHPMYWTKEMSDAWHKAIPDVEKAFNALIQASHQSQAKGE